MNQTNYWVYMLLCENNTYYTGYTNNLVKRYEAHINKTGKCKYTQSFRVIRMVQCWKVSGDKALAMQIERMIKKLSRSNKENLITNPSILSEDSRICPIPKER